MGNVISTPKIRKDKKKKNLSGTDIGKSKRQPTNSNSKAANRTSRDLYGHRSCSRATNPFIIFYLELRNKKPKEHVTVIAQAAGKLWGCMTPEQKKMYVDLANAEKKRRQDMRRKRKRSSARSR